MRTPNPFEYVDTSAGPHECHPWTGRINKSFTRAGNNTAPYAFGQLDLEGGKGILAHRAVVQATFGVTLGPEAHIHQICENRLCCNVRHLAIGPRGLGINSALPVCEVFAAPPTKAAA